MKPTTTSLWNGFLLAAVMLATACGQKTSVPSPSQDTTRVSNAVVPTEVVDETLVAAIESPDTTVSQETEVPSSYGKRHILWHRRLKRFFRRPENVDGAKEMRDFVKTNNPTLIPHTRATSPEERQARVDALLAYLDANRSSLSPSAQSLLDRVESIRESRSEEEAVAIVGE